jgi:hypothetical protein
MDQHRQNREPKKKNVSKRSQKRKASETTGCSSSNPKRSRNQGDPPSSSTGTSLVTRRKSSRNDDDVPTFTEPTTVFDVITNTFSNLITRARPYYYQLTFESETDMFEGIGTFSELFQLDENETFKVLEAAGLVTRNKKKKVRFKSDKLEALKSKIEGFDFKIRCGRGRSCLILMGGMGPPAAALDHQIHNKTKPPEIAFLSKLRESFKAHTCIKSLLTTVPASNQNAAASNQNAAASNQNAAASNQNAASN